MLANLRLSKNKTDSHVSLKKKKRETNKSLRLKIISEDILLILGSQENFSKEIMLKIKCDK